MPRAPYRALIKTHHITSRKKVSALKSAAEKHNVYALLRSGGVPGLMYVEGDDEQGVKDWVDTVHDLRYKDYQLIARPGEVGAENGAEEGKGSGKLDKGNKGETKAGSTLLGQLEEIGSVKEFGAEMDTRGVLRWWRAAMGFI